MPSRGIRCRRRRLLLKHQRPARPLTVASAIEVVDRVETREHSIGTRVDRTLASPAGCRRLVYELARLGRERVLQSDPRWESTIAAQVRGEDLNC